MKFATSVAIVLLATSSKALAQSDGCTSTTQSYALENLACTDSAAPLSASADSVGPTSFGSCCPNLVADSDSRRLFGIDSSKALSTSRSLQDADTCRSIEITNAYCDISENSTSGCNPDNANLDISFAFAYQTVTSEELCCSTCVCWGDPRCTSFDGSRANWIVCDDRRASNCLHGPVRCQQQTDPWGNQCEYVRNTRKVNGGGDAPYWISWDESGSPCQSTAIWEGTNFPTMVMYEGEGQTITLTLGERGIISAMTVTDTSGTYSLSSSDCLSDTTSSAWTSSVSSIPDTWSVNVESDSRVRWSIQNDAATVFTSVLCQETSDYRSRLDINLKIPTSGDSDVPSSEGFCSTGTISEDSAGTGTLSIEQDDMCLRNEVGGCIEACKALVDATCLEDNLESNVRYWCEMNDLTGVTPSIDSVDACVARIIDEENCTETSYNWADIVCQIDNMNSDQSGYDETGYNQCISDIEDFTWFQYVTDRPTYTVTAPTSAPTECISNVAEYNTSKSYECAVGVQVQSLNPDTNEYEDEFFIPVEYPPCNDILNISGADYPNVVTRPIRFVQCESIQSQCSTVNSCLPTNGFEITVNYNMEFCPTPEPTNAPTESPTAAPTLTPTESPTAAPTEAPTEAPTAAPTEAPTEAPTAAPTETPTEAPTAAPTETPTEAPTAAPTETPTEAPTEAPTQSPAGPSLSPTVTPQNIEGNTCYECQQFTEGQNPQICVTTTTEFHEIGECETCCTPEGDETFPPLTEYGYCRSQETVRPYCDTSNATENEYCSQLSGGSAQLEINITFNSPEDSPISCCRDCAIYGDPEMTSFKALGLTLNISAWVICDGRVIPEDGSTCPIEEDQCVQELDQDGNACYYNSTRAGLLTDQSNIGAIGSPCQANPDSGEAIMEVYTIPSGDLSISAVLGERAVITEVPITVGGEIYTLISSDCFGAAGSGWDKDVSNVFENITYDSSDVRSTARGAERTWSFNYDESIYIQITCLKMIAQGGSVAGMTGYRMNIDHIIDIDTDRANSTESTGYCPTNVVDYQSATPTDTSTGSVFNECTWQQWSTGLTLAKALVATATTTAQIKSAVEEWCQTANVFNTDSDPASACYSKIVGKSSNYQVIGERWATQYCTAISSNRGTLSLQRWLNQCTAEIFEETFGIVNLVETYGTGARDTENTCLSNPTYEASQDTCTEGIFVEYYVESSDSWVEEFFIPALEMPCNGIVTVDYADHPNLFTNNIRFRQCDQQANNGCTLAFSCMSAQGYSVSYRFSQDASICPSSGSA